MTADYKSILASKLNRQPVWAMREFRLLVVGMVVALALVAVVVFEIFPAANRKPPAELAAPVLKADELSKDTSVRAGMDKVKDFVGVDEFDEPYRGLLRSLSSVGSDDLYKQARQVSYALFGSHSKELRGRVLRLPLLLFGASEAMRLDKPVGDIEWVYRTYLADASGNEGYVVDLVEPPPATLRRRELVSVDALFLRMAKYEGQKGLVQAPQLLGRSLKAVSEKLEPQGLSGTVMVASIVIPAVILVIFLTVRIWMKSRPQNPMGPGIGRA